MLWQIWIIASVVVIYKCTDFVKPQLAFLLQISSYYGKCLPTVEPTARIFTTQLNELPVTHSSMSLAVDSYDHRDYRMMNAPTSQRILPPSEPDYMLPPSSWTPPFSVCREQLIACTNFADVRPPRASSAERYCEAAVPAEPRSRAAVEEDLSKMSGYQGGLCSHHSPEVTSLVYWHDEVLVTRN